MSKLTALTLLALCCAGAIAELIPVQPMLPVNPKYSFREWQRILNSQTITPEVCENCKEGVVPQPEIAGQVVVRGHDERIIGGFSASAGQFPWQVQVRMDNSYFCGGSVISENWILSAGHCAYGFRSFVIVLGSLYTQSGDVNSVVISSRQGIPHAQYNPNQISNDISVIKLSTPVSGWNSYIRPILLPALSQGSNTFAGETVVLSGWGRYGTTSVSPSISNELRFVSLVVIDNTVCAQTFGSGIRPTNICTGGSSRAGGPIGACNGDSGGALAIQGSDNAYTQVGIVSFGTSLGCNLKYPSAFTRVTSYLKWVSDTTGIAIRN